MEQTVYNYIKSTRNKTNLTNLNLHALFWNIEGAHQLHEMCKSDIDKLVNSHIICLYETWSEKSFNFSEFNRFSKIEILAKRVHTKGRARGGLITLWRNDIFTLDKCITQRDHFILIRLRVGDAIILVGGVYIQPGAEYDFVLEEFN